MHTRHAEGMCLSARGREEVGSRGEVRLAVVLSDSSTQQHSPSQPSIFFFFFFFSWSPVLLRCEGSSSVLADTPAQTKAFLSFIYRALMRFLSVFPPSLLPHPPAPLCSLFAVRCGGCAEAISPAELVMRAGAAVFHLRCFTCSVCSCRLQTGDRCVLREGQLLCAREDYHQCLASPTSSDTGTGCSGQCVLCPITYGLFCLFQMIKAV